MFYMIWPEYRYLSIDEVEMMYSDAVFNHDVDQVDCVTPEEKAKELHHAGLITLGRER